jgi:ribonuclease HI
MWHQIRSQLLWECKQNLIYLAKRNKVTLVWVPGHRGIAGNEKAGALAREGSANTFTGPEPVFGITKTTA